jgi:hypothetical protein
MKSPRVCALCGVSVGLWAKGQGSYWKHQNGGMDNRSCGKPPRVIERSIYEADLAAMVDAVTTFRLTK